MAKKYLSLEEAASQLGITEEKLKKAREDGDIRGFADRGNWKFRQEDLEEFGRTMQADSSPDVQMYSETPEDEGASDSGVRLVLDSNLTEGDSSDDAIDLEEGESSADIPISFGDSSGEMELEGDSSADIPLSLGDSDEEFGLNLDDDSSEDVPLAFDDSDSDVKLATSPGDSSLLDSSSEVLITGRESDSDVRLLDHTVPMIMDAKSDSDVRLIKTDSDSDVKLVGSESDSDVRLLSPDAGAEDSDSDVELADPATGETEVAINLSELDSDYDDGSSESILAIDDESGIALSEDSGISIDGAIDSGISLDTGESGIALEAADDSGISLDAGEDSGISLDMADDSGIALDTGDSDISLATDDDEDDEGLTLDTASDSGISLDMPADSGISLDQDEVGQTVPMMNAGPLSDDSADPTSETMVAIPALGEDDDDESDFELGALEGDSSSDTSVLLFDDEDDADDRAATMIKKRGDDDEETFDLDAGDAFDEEFDDDDLLGEDDEIEDFVDDEDFMADDDDFDDSFSTGESQADFVAPVGVSAGPAEEQEWGGLMFGAVLLGSFAMVACALVMFDLIRYMWATGDSYNAGVGPMIDMMGIK